MLHRTRIKFCGLTRSEDIRCALQLGVDAIGLVFCQGSSRAVTVEQAQRLAGQMTPFVTLVGLFMDNTADEVAQVLRGCPALAVLQFHGSEEATFCRQFGLPYMKALPMNDAVDFDRLLTEFPDAQGFVADSHSQQVGQMGQTGQVGQTGQTGQTGQMGGSGRVFDWAKIPDDFRAPLVLAGGLDEHNVAQAIQQVRPYAVDVSSGIEQAKGIKDPQRMAAFVIAVTRADRAIVS